jgi:hypothetical protein
MGASDAVAMTRAVLARRHLCDTPPPGLSHGNNIPHHTHHWPRHQCPEAVLSFSPSKSRCGIPQFTQCPCGYGRYVKKSTYIHTQLISDISTGNRVIHHLHESQGWQAQDVCRYEVDRRSIVEEGGRATLNTRCLPGCMHQSCDKDNSGRSIVEESSRAYLQTVLLQTASMLACNTHSLPWHVVRVDLLG